MKPAWWYAIGLLWTALNYVADPVGRAEMLALVFPDIRGMHCPVCLRLAKKKRALALAFVFLVPWVWPASMLITSCMFLFPRTARRLLVRWGVRR